jgi:hypothetical protein
VIDEKEEGGLQSGIMRKGAKVKRNRRKELIEFDPCQLLLRSSTNINVFI